MAYWFQGFFVATPDSATAEHIRQRIRSDWPNARSRYIARPFAGVGFCWFDDAPGQTRYDPDDLDAQLGPWTHAFPTVTFVRIEAVCFGGVCDYDGVVWRDGEAIWREPRDAEEGDGPLLRLLTYLGITSPKPYFEPLTRGYFAPL